MELLHWPVKVNTWPFGSMNRAVGGIWICTVCGWRCTRLRVLRAKPDDEVWCDGDILTDHKPAGDRNVATP
jgi:hypothetical protein